MCFIKIKKLLIILLCLPMIGFGQTLIPDANFEQALINLGYDTGTPNASVPTANINTIHNLNCTNLNISDLTGIEDFTALTYLYCDNNQLTTLDVSQNPGLEYLWCGHNELTSLDITTALTHLWCQNNQLTTLDVSGNTSLNTLSCKDNQLICLDVSNNSVLDELWCYDNLLAQLNTKNGNWQNMIEFEAAGNNLTCVEVDDIGYANTNWISSVDNGVIFNTNCNYTNPCNTTSAIEEHTTNKELLRTVDVLGRETKNKPLFYIYDDGTVEKRIVIE